MCSELCKKCIDRMNASNASTASSRNRSSQCAGTSTKNLVRPTHYPDLCRQSLGVVDLLRKQHENTTIKPAKLFYETWEIKHHVHFSGGSGLGKNNNIMIQPQRHGHIDAHLGFLQLYHRYLINFSVPWNTCIHPEEETIGPTAIAGNHSANCHIVSFESEKDGLRLTIELLAYKEKILKEDIEVMCCRSGTPLKIVLNARVLAKDKGTPLLRNGIRSIGVEGTEDEVSE